MADALRPRLDRLQELSKQVNSSLDDAGRIIQGVEAYLSDVLHIGVSASVPLEYESEPEEYYRSERDLNYARFGPKFRIFVSHLMESHGHPQTSDQTLWANCSRDVKLLAFNKLPELLDCLISSLEGTLAQVEASSEMIQAYLPPIKEKAAKS
jgi:hypothetical protein